MTVVTEDAAVRAVLETLHPSAKHVHWWTRVHGTRKNVKIIYRPGRLNATTDALSRCPHSEAPAVGEGEDETQVAVVSIGEGSVLASVPGLQTRKGGRPGTYCTCICAHAPNIPDILPYNSVNQCTDEKHGHKTE